MCFYYGTTFSLICLIIVWLSVRKKKAFSGLLLYVDPPIVDLLLQDIFCCLCRSFSWILQNPVGARVLQKQPEQTHGEDQHTGNLLKSQQWHWKSDVEQSLCESASAIICRCLIQENFASLQGLLFSCKYKVLLQPISKKSRPLAESTSFFTPSCATIQAKNPKSIACPRETGEIPYSTYFTVSNQTIRMVCLLPALSLPM